METLYIFNSKDTWPKPMHVLKQINAPSMSPFLLRYSLSFPSHLISSLGLPCPHMHLCSLKLSMHKYARSNEITKEFRTQVTTTTTMIPFSVCYYSELHSAIISNENVIFYHAKSFMVYNVRATFVLSLGKIELLSKTLLHCVAPNSNTN